MEQFSFDNFVTIIQLVSNIFVIISVVLIYFDYIHRKDIEKADKSINIAKIFAEEIITKIAIISNTFETTGMTKIIERAKFLDFTEFNTDELKNLYDENSIKDYLELERQIDREHLLLIDMTLNQLEYLSMYIQSGVADGDYIYNSIHQSFLACIKLLYLRISLQNYDVKNKYYTNIIFVYNGWKNKYIKHIEKEQKIEKKLKPKTKKVR